MKGDKGWFNARLSYLREVQNKMNKSDKSKVSNSSQLDENASPISDDEAISSVLLLKSLVVTEENMETFIQKLNLTREYRQRMLLEKSINLKEQFPYFFTHPLLVKIIYFDIFIYNQLK